MKPRMFIASSTEHLDLAYAAQEGLEYDVEATVWNQGVFQLSRTTMASLVDVLDESEFGLFILAPDDITTIRANTRQTVRDNVIFELGLFIGKLGADRCFLIVPHGGEDLHLPTDLLGLTPATFAPDRTDGNLVAALGPACNRIRKSIRKLGQLEARPGTSVAGDPERHLSDIVSSHEGLISDPNDCISLIQSWMGSRASELNRQAIKYDEVDRVLKLAKGSARKHIEEAARHWSYKVLRKGEQTIIFDD